MDAETFQTLALRVIAGEATADDRHALEAELAHTPERHEDYQHLQITHDVMRLAAPMADAALATVPELPAWRVSELRTAVRQQFGPATDRVKKPAWLPMVRWIFGSAGLSAFAAAVVILCFANRNIEIGLYGSDLARDGTRALSAQDVPTAKVIAFEQDAPFDAWQNRPLAWNERGKVWIDNEHDLLHVVKRTDHGVVTTELPLAPTDEAQRAQIQQAVDGMK